MWIILWGKKVSDITNNYANQIAVVIVFYLISKTVNY